MSSTGTVEVFDITSGLGDHLRCGQTRHGRPARVRPGHSSGRGGAPIRAERQIGSGKMPITGALTAIPEIPQGIRTPDWTFLCARP